MKKEKLLTAIRLQHRAEIRVYFTISTFFLKIRLKFNLNLGRPYEHSYSRL